MVSRLNPHLGFKDNAREAMQFYQSVFGGKLSINTFSEFEASQDSNEDNKIMHAMLEAENGLILMAADTPNHMEYKPGSAITLSLSGDNEAELRGYWEKLLEGGSITMPLEAAPWGDTFGMLTDKFGTEWMVNISSPQDNK